MQANDRMLAQYLFENRISPPPEFSQRIDRVCWRLQQREVRMNAAPRERKRKRKRKARVSRALVIAASVLGGGRMAGGKGTVLGALLGMALLTIVDNSLILLDISTTWQKVFTGAIIIIGTAASALQAKRDERKLTVKLNEGGK